MATATERFLRYVSFDTQSADGANAIPSTQKQFDLANALVQEMREMGIHDARVDEHCYVYGSLPATAPDRNALGFVAHMDTSPAASGANVRPRIVKNYAGGDIPLAPGVTIEAAMFPALAKCVGEDLIVTDGTTLLGADDKAGIAEILTMAEFLLAHPEVQRGKICIAFTPDEEVGSGADAFDLTAFGADFAYTVDGGEVGEIEYENFNAASAHVTVHGLGIHPGSAKDRMVNALNVAMEFHAMLPAFERPEHTEGYEGFFHLDEMHGDVVRADLDYIIRDHDRARFEARKRYAADVAEAMNARYGAGTVEVKLVDSYYNMREVMEKHMDVIHRAEEACRAVGIRPHSAPIRGGTDGCRLSFMGLPCPDLGTGGFNCHSRHELIAIEDMDAVTAMLVELVRAR